MPPKDQAPETSLTPMHDALLAALAQNSEKLATAAIELKGSFQFSRRMKTTLLVGSIVVVLLLFSVAGVIFLAVINRSALDAIRDCTNPHGHCAQQGQQQTASAVGLIIQQDTRNFEIVQVCASSASVVTEQNARDDVHYLLAIENCVAKLQAMQRAPTN